MAYIHNEPGQGHDHAHEHNHSRFQVSRKMRLRAVIAISFCFFAAEISVGFYTKSLALVADAFHYLNDLIGFIVALVAVQLTERENSPADLSFGWQRASLLGAFFNGSFLIALGVSIALQAIERFISIEHVQNPKLVLIVGCVGLALNVISALFLHEHDHDHGSSDSGDEETLSSSSTHANHLHIGTKPRKHGMDLGILGVLIHVIGDAINNIGVIISAVIIWFVKSPNRFYADPAVSMWIAIMILLSAIPLTKNSGKILLQSAPIGVKIDDIKHDLEAIPGIMSVHDLHVWRLDQKKAVASAHIVVNDPDIASFMKNAKICTECLHAYGIHSVTLQPELPVPSGDVEENTSTTSATSTEKCGVPCGELCEEFKCCA
ncbi:Cation efflux protein [Pyrenophora tritici-repentis]|uniref:Cation efflux protein n=3 Tax=Pyrenophora tritici-repentis TaxID=45151 RepID=A0A922SYY7_9PLEO|nr:Cation efflux protein [Pyrenophora tritici-repentis]KAI1673791.1 Cation efflux protein [Pyrenophora tritici-repentis]KAI1689122.1 Cation efflux protein [Pyrenophora tritici-repentis]